MAVPIIMPRPGQSVETCIITEWKKQAGDEVKAGDVLFTYETDKATFEEEAKEDGILLAVFCTEQEEIPCLATVAVLGREGENVDEFRKSAEQEAQSEADIGGEKADRQKIEPVEQDASFNERFAGGAVSPRARRLAEKMKIAPDQVAASGPYGRIIERDIRNAAGTRIGTAEAGDTEEKRMAGEGYVDEALSQIRKTIAKAMTASLTCSAQLTHHISFDASNLLAFRKNVKEMRETLDIPNITLNDTIQFIVVKMLQKYPYLNTHFLGEKIRRFSSVNLGVAVDTPRGLLVPTIFGAERMSLIELAESTRILSAKAREGSISPDLLQGGTFTVSNLGAFGIESFTPILNYPQTGLLGVCGITDRVRRKNGNLDVYPAMGLSLTYDHRAVDGAPASAFLQALAKELESLDLLKG